MSAYLPSDVNENRDDYFDLPDAGEDEDEPELCARCGVPLTSADYEGERCSQCGFRLKGKEQ